MWTIYIDNPPVDDFTLLMVQLSINTITSSVQVSQILLLSNHLPVDVFSSSVNIYQTSKPPEKDINLVYLNGKAALLAWPTDLRQSVCNDEESVIIRLSHGDTMTSTLDTIKPDTSINRALIREFVYVPPLPVISHDYLFYPYLDQDYDISTGSKAINTLGYSYDTIAFDRVYKRYRSKLSGLYVKPNKGQKIPKILHLIEDRVSAWERVLPTDWVIRVWTWDMIADVMVNTNWLTYYTNADDHEMRSFIISLAVLKTEGGVIIPPNVTPKRTFPRELLANDLLVFFDDDYGIDLSVYGSIPHSRTNIFMTIETMIARGNSIEEIKAFMLTQFVFPSYTSFLDMVIVEQVCDEPMTKPVVSVTNIASTKRQLSINPRDLYNLG